MKKKTDFSWLPDELDFGQPYFFLRGRREIFLQNIRRIIHYSDTCIKLQSADTDVCLKGCGLCICFYQGDEIKITGKIEQIELV